MPIDLCKRCGKPKAIFKDGFCKDCYTTKIEKIYVLKPYTKFHANTQVALIEEIANNPHFDKKEITEKYCISLTRLYAILNKYFDKIYVDKEKAKVDIPNQIK